MSLVHSARMNGHDPYAYLRDVLERLPTQPASRIAELPAASLVDVERERLIAPPVVKTGSPDAYARTNLGGITKRGDTYLRSLLIQGAKSAVMTAHKRSDPISQWAAALRDRAGWQKAVVALANKKRTHPVGGDDQGRRVRCTPRQRQAGCNHDHHPDRSAGSHGRRVASNDPSRSRHQPEDAKHRSDRQRANSTNPWWLDSSMST